MTPFLSFFIVVFSSPINQYPPIASTFPLIEHNFFLDFPFQMHLLSKHICKERNSLTQQKYSRIKCLNWVLWEPEIWIKGLSLCWGCIHSGSWEWEKRKGSREGDNATSWVYPSLWVQLQSESQRQKRVTRPLIHGLCKKSVKELHLEVAPQEKEHGEFLFPSHFHHPFPTGWNLPLWALPAPLFGPLVSERLECLPWDMALYLSPERGATWYEQRADQGTREVVEGPLRNA